MPPDASATPFPADSSRLFESLTSLLRARTVEDAAESVLGLVAAEGAVEARLWLECPEHQFETSWRRAGSEAPVAEPFLADLRTRATRGDPIVHSEGGVEWTALPIPGREGCAGVLTVGYPDRAGYDAVRLAGLASVLGAKALHFRTQREMSQDRERTADWFKTLDDQIRILEGERQKLAALVNKTDAAVFVTDPEGHITWVNPTMSRRHEQVRHRILPGTTCALLCGMESGCMNCPIRLVREGASIVHQERRERRAEGVRTLYVSAFPVRSPEGTVSSVLVMIQDITDLETLRRSEARYQLLFERSPDAMVMAIPGSLEIVMANRQARNVLGIDPGRAEPPTLLELHPRTLQPEMKTRYDALATGSPLENIEVGVLAREESRIMNASGSVFDLDGTDVLLLEFRDVTRLRELQSELARADHLIALGTMNAGIAHEFKNRLAPLRMFAQLLSTDRYDPQRILAHAPLILREVDRLSNLVRDVLDYARPQVPRPAHENLERLAREFTDECRKEYLAVIEETGVRVEFHAEPGPYDVWVDAGQLGRAFLNLFKNGLEALETHSGERILRVELSRRGREVVLALCDSGHGIAPEALGRIFDPFYTTKGPRGTGLGMSITRSLIEANGGVIRVESRSGRGTRAEIRFLEIARADPGTEERKVA